MRPDRICSVCGGSKNEDEEICNVCVELGETLDDGTSVDDENI